MLSRVKEKLRTGDILIPGDQWPIFLYNEYSYDPEDPWNGLFQSALLVLVSLPVLMMSPMLTNILGI